MGLHERRVGTWWIAGAVSSQAMVEEMCRSVSWRISQASHKYHLQQLLQDNRLLLPDCSSKMHLGKWKADALCMLPACPG